MKAFKYKLKPSRRVAARLDATLDVCRELYNAALQERRAAYQQAKTSLNYYDQASQLSEIRDLREDVAGVHSQVLQDVLKRLDKAYKAFFTRVKKGAGKVGFPRFKGRNRYASFTYPQSGFKLEGNKLTLSKIGSVRLRLSREAGGKIKTCSLRRQADGWFVIFIAEAAPLPLPKTGESVGIDVGLENFATLSTGEVIENPRFLRTAEAGLKRQQRKVSKKKRGGANRKKAVRLLARQHLKVAHQRQDFFHKTANQLLREFDEIAIEDLNIKGMVKNHHLAKAITDAAWRTFVNILTAKAENAGRKVWKVAPAYTSQDCSQCRARVKKSLAVREHRCIVCGYVAQRDHNAARNILARTARVARAGVTLPVDQRIPCL